MIHKLQYTIRLLTLGLLLATFGCGGDDGPPMGTVEGTVTLDGKPLPNVLVNFNPGEFRPSEAKTDESGHYELIYTREKKGAVVGTHKVVITSKTGVDAEGNEIADEEEKVPAKYNSESTLTEEVKAGANTIDFKLES